MKKNIKFCLMIAILLLAGSACNKDYLDKDPLSGPSNQSFFTSQDELILAVNGIYTAMAITPTDAMPYNTTIDATTDINWDRNTSGLQALGKGNQDSNSDYALNLWTHFTNLLPGVILSWIMLIR
jgi:hypothetical protein